MVAIGLSAGAVARVRFALSCLWETVASVRVLRDPGQHAIHLPWANRVRPRLAEAGLVGPGGGLLWHLVPPAPGYLADFLTPPPAGLAPDLGQELAALRATPPETVRAHLDLYNGPRPPALSALHADPEDGLHRLAEEIEAYWRLALAGDWPRIRALLEAEVFRRARLLAEDGAAGLLNDLHERVRWEGDALLISQRHCAAPDVPDGSGLVLVPSVFAWPSVLSISAGDVPQLAYPARGLGALWACPPTAPDALGAVLGRGRARLLAALDAPRSTTDLARRTGLSPAGVSQHLTALRAAGLVVTHRQGRSLLSSRTAVAEALLTASA
ncbi:winged helix-turn-helix domain-containing protein [Micromonospora sp. DR5-3]|uniref:ArsR/SmtB family transcription factor n=1 Tax=unclassified Micromonospora TaxID=2617518 RepID=UPI0011DC2B87|nr:MULTISPECIES: helix-turn-helix domain-containing protein [unclassified Micromonospora]MCW3813226.1 winged helix-turn-helix domain-containing protein [Micromonospora sp. DR5-3]TYC24621.1 winged helix-turn-helix transcriptional regulator [Micromonospora sp. MP36]